MMQNAVTYLHGMLCLLLSISSSVVFAQSGLSTVTKIPAWQENYDKLYNTPERQKLKTIQERTDPQYYQKTYGAQGRLAKGNGATMRTALDCGRIVCSSATLPVTLLSFKGERIDVSTARLTWETTSETNNAGFEVERSSMIPMKFEKIGFVDGGGNSVKTKTYKFQDGYIDAGIQYYRLKQLDYDGSYQYSRVVAVNAFKDLLSVISAPNPGSHNQTYFQLRGHDHSQKIEITILNTSGVAIYKNGNALISANNRISLSRLPKLATGNYVARIVSGDQQATVSFVIVAQ